MSTQSTASPGSGAPVVHRADADRAYRRAWWSLALYPVSFVAAFAIGEGVISMLTDDSGDPAFWQVLLAATPALLAFVIPGILAVAQGRKARRLGRSDGMVPAIVGAAIAAGFLALNGISYLVGLVLG
jgi:hypothetical protein